MTDKEFLNWLADRLVHVYNESPNADFVHRLREISDKLYYLDITLSVDQLQHLTKTSHPPEGFSADTEW